MDVAEVVDDAADAEVGVVKIGSKLLLVVSMTKLLMVIPARKPLLCG